LGTMVARACAVAASLPSSHLILQNKEGESFTAPTWVSATTQESTRTQHWKKLKIILSKSIYLTTLGDSHMHTHLLSF